MKKELIGSIFEIIIGLTFVIVPIIIGINWLISTKNFNFSTFVVFAVSVIGIIILVSGIKGVISYIKNE